MNINRLRKAADSALDLAWLDGYNEGGRLGLAVGFLLGAMLGGAFVYVFGVLL